ncbi:hypothetical protein KUCAC02_006877 [Chaenocephalus aceratus]|uniref:Uncharacterized protein n=1 Tax=Chaenocephalus aceratus TaxID=36190 RepID=A0ACB9VUU8_CHAAC|nr:hypothetical protein KUCAC02_006877 [Chaenocephalus aceratus]
MSAGNKVIELQLQMRQNAEDLQSYMSELQSWETDIKKRDEELRTGGLQQDQKEHHFKAWSPEKQVQPTNKSREEETRVGTVMHYNHKAEQQTQLAKSKAA